MSVVMSMRWPGITPELYEAARAEVGWEERAPDGGYLHVAWFDADGLRVTDVWASPEHFQRFGEERLLPVVKGKLGVTSEPVVTFTPLHRRFVAPGISGAASS